MGDFLNHVGHEFTLGNVDSGAPVSIQSKTPDSTGPNGEFVPGQPMTVTHQLQRPTFLSAFLSNLPSAIPLGVENSMRPGGGVATGIAGGLQGIQQNKVLQQSLASQQAEANLKNEQAKSLSSQVTLPNGMTVPFALAKTIYPSLLNSQTRQNISDQDNAVKMQLEQMREANKPDTAAQEDQRYEKIIADKNSGKTVAPDDLTWAGAYEKRKTLGTMTTFNANAANRNDARADKSYQFHTSQLEKLGKPIDDATQRLGRLQDTLSQNTPQADALVAPELLTVMAGGQGSGLRMNEAEISRIVGGRSNWESLKASANKWSTDPNTANSITPSQRQQIRALVSAVQLKLNAKQNAIDAARQSLVDSDNPADHKSALLKARLALNSIDQGANNSGITVADPRGVLHTFSNQAAADAFKKAAGIK